MRTALLFYILAFISSCAAADSTLLTKQELAKLLGPEAHTTLRWSRRNGPDFTVYQGESAPPLSGGVGFYVGGYPHFEPAKGSSTHRGRLGTFEVVWYRETQKDSSLYQEALITLSTDSYRVAIHVWVFGPRESDLDAIIQEIGTIPLFSKRLSTETQ